MDFSSVNRLSCIESEHHLNLRIGSEYAGALANPSQQNIALNHHDRHGDIMIS
jgi:hypothetical protein